ncbi:hypothetical protein JYU34_016984 [Plutella xylostella]|uniref:Uncharacterized protein n=1 Tax=Plutella xylostella TaxID=51655 RepID=A0ABQ7Q5D5_PLUXY|nr:hypothetical protein JYU34_016984 [Plutella xylostella]
MAATTNRTIQYWHLSSSLTPHIGSALTVYFHRNHRFGRRAPPHYSLNLEITEKRERFSRKVVGTRVGAASADVYLSAAAAEHTPGSRWSAGSSLQPGELAPLHGEAQGCAPTSRERIARPPRATTDRGMSARRGLPAGNGN